MIYAASAVRDLVRSGVSEKVAMTITGHKTRSVFERYTIVSQADIREALNKREQSRVMHNFEHNSPKSDLDEARDQNAKELNDACGST